MDSVYSFPFQTRAFRPGAIGTADAAQLADAHPAGALQVSPTGSMMSMRGVLPTMETPVVMPNFIRSAAAQRALRPPEFGVGALVIDLLRQIIPVVPVFKQVLMRQWPAWPWASTKPGRTAWPHRVDDPTRLRQNREGRSWGR